MKKSLLALAVSLVAVSSANAAWNTGNDPLLINGNGELVLLAFDPVTQNSYTQDLGVTFNQLRAGYTGTIGLDSAHIGIFGGNYSNVQYALFAGSNTQYLNDEYAEFNYSERGLIYSLTPGQTVWDTDSTNTDGSIAGAISVLDLIASGTGFAYDLVDENPGHSVAAGGLGYAGSSLNGVAWYEGVFNRDASGANGSLVELWLKGYTQDDGFGDPLNQLLGTATLNLAGGSISLVSATPAVPVPAAAWLMGSALLGLGGIARRRRA